MRKITITVDDVSLSARRAWIEIVLDGSKSSIEEVALRKESVDRNEFWTALNHQLKVALRKESVDRNFCVRLQLLLMMVALRKESVDRNSRSSPC